MRFYGNLEYALECVALKQVTFLHIDKLNDPFDPNMFFETDFNADYQTILNHVQQHHPRDISQFKNKLPQDKWEGLIEDMAKRSNYFRNTLFIFSTTKVSQDNHPKDNLYMWSHYANGHKGVAIEFDTALLGKGVLIKHESFNQEVVELNDVWTEIKYQDDLMKLTCEHIFNFVINDTPIENEQAWMRTELANILRERGSLKLTGWNIEEEWRLMWQDEETRMKIYRLNLLDDSIKAVYLGFRYPLIDDYMNDDLIFETKRNFPNAEIYKALKGKGKHLLDFEQIVT
jgi:hypothetical protein